MVVLQEKVTLEDSKWHYQNVQIPKFQKASKANKQLDKERIPIKFITVTEDKGISLEMIEQSTNRVLSKDNPENFIGISFEKFQFNDPHRNQTASYIESMLKGGIKLNGRTYYFYGHSNSQLKRKTCYLLSANNGEEVFKKINDLGDFTKITSVAKRAKRIGLLFSAAESKIQLDEKKTLDIEDVEENGNIFTDGCGLMSKDYAKQLAQWANVIFHNERYTPSVFQIRYKGYKGTLMVIPRLGAPHHVHFRDSMKKFSSCPDNTFAILDFSKPYTFGFLNGELVTLLSTLGISDDIFLRKQQAYFSFLRDALILPKSAFFFLSYKGENDLAEKVLLNGISPVRDSIRRLQKEEWKGCYDKKDKEKVRIMIPESRLLYGVADYTGTLKEGEVHVRITVEGRGVRTLDGAEVIVGRNPCLHPGDIRKFKAVRNDLLGHLEDCIVFPTVGKRDAPSLMSGGDLDGDRFFVSWDPDLIPEKVYEPYGYPPAKEILRREIKQGDMIRYFANYNNASLGKVKNLYLSWAKSCVDLAGSKECQELNALFSSCVDGERIKIPEHLESPPVPATGKIFILDALCEAVRLHANIEFETDAEGLNETPEELLASLLTSDAVCLKEFELFQMAARWCQKNNELLENYLHCFVFGAFTFQERHLALQQFESSVHKEKIAGLLYNGLLSSKLLTHDQLRNGNLDDKRIYWQKFYSSDNDNGRRLEGSITKALELFERKFIVLRVDNSLKIGMYVPRRLLKGEELFIGDQKDSVKLFAFTESGDLYKTWTNQNYKLYFDGDMIQLFDKNRRNTFVWLGLQNGKFPSKIADTEFKVSIALQKFNGHLSKTRAKVAKEESKGMEIYVISNRDRVGHQILDITMSQKDTKEIVRLLRNIPKEYSLSIVHGEISWENREFCKDIIARNNFVKLKELPSICEWNQIFLIYQSLSDEKFVKVVYYVIKNFDSFQLKFEIWHEIFKWIDEFPIISTLVVEALSIESSINIYPMEKHMYASLVHAVIQTANFAKELVLNLFRKLVRVLIGHKVVFPVNYVTKMVKWIVYCVRHTNVANDLLNELFNEETNIFGFGEGGDNQTLCYNYLKKFTLAVAKDYIGELNDKCPCDHYAIPEGAEDIQFENVDDNAPKSLNEGRLEKKKDLSDFLPNECKTKKFYGTKPVPVMKCAEIMPTEKEGFYKTNLRADVVNSIRNGDHLRFCASRRSVDTPNKRITTFDAIAESVQNGTLTFEIKQREPQELYIASWNVYYGANTTTFNAMLVAIKTLITKKEKSTVIFNSIIGLLEELESEEPIERKKVTIPSSKYFNTNQEMAITEALNNPLTLIWGPPGTGKTTVIVEILLQFLEHRKDLRILVAASTHNAVDNVLSRFLFERKSRLGDEKSNDVIRIASDMDKVSKKMAKWTLNAFVGANIHTNHKAMKEAQERLDCATFVFSTCSAAGVGLLRPCEDGDVGDDHKHGVKKPNKKRSELKFDVVIVDEASQITEPNALIPIVKNSMFVILVGDHEQLRPTVSEIAKECGLGTSLFEKLYANQMENCKKIMLNVQYRMQQELAQFPSVTFYEGKLATGVKDQDRIIPDSKFPWPVVNGVKFPNVFVECSTLERHVEGSTSKVNTGQCQKIIEIINALLGGQSAEAPLTITVLSPYTKQVTEIRQKLISSKTKIDVETVDSFQGRESDIIIYSSVVANTSRRLGFLEDARRMNVAITRAKYGLILIGNRSTLSSNKLWKGLIDKCKEVIFPL